MKKVALDDVLAYREKRVWRRQELLEQYQQPVVCLTLNIPGEYKDFPWARRCFTEGIVAFSLKLQTERIAVTHLEHETEEAGCTAYLVTPADPDILKTNALQLENDHSLGRLFDIDVYDTDGEKRSRAEYAEEARACFVCGGNAFACGRSRAHSQNEACKAVLRIMETWFRQNAADTVSSAAIWAMMSEAAITPKPGLVDRANSGSHTDMDFFTFIDSAQALLPWFRFCALAGFDSVSTNESIVDSEREASSATEIDPQTLFERIRAQGRIAETLMRKASGGVNVHRGYIFSVGILSAAYGRLYRNTETPRLKHILDLVKEMTVSLGDDFSRSGKGERSHGEAIYIQSGIQGIRGEVSRGFPSVRQALPLLRAMLDEGASLNDAGVAVLLNLLAHAEDTNIIHRSSIETLKAIQQDL